MRNDGCGANAGIIGNELDLILADIDEAISALDISSARSQPAKAAGFKEQIAFIVSTQNDLKTRFRTKQNRERHSIVTTQQKHGSE